MLHFHIHDKNPIPHLEENIAKQKREGGRLILYRRVWSALFVTVSQDRIEHVPFDHSRILAGWRHMLFTLLLGIWSLGGIFAVPMLLIMNLRGGIDVTGQFSDSSIDPDHVLPPDAKQGERDTQMAQLIFVLIGMSIIAWILYSYYSS